MPEFNLEVTTNLLDEKGAEFLSGSNKKSKLKKLQDDIGVPLKIAIPDSLLRFSRISLNLLKALKVTELLCVRVIISKIQKTKKYPDEPYIHIFYTDNVSKINSNGADFFDEENALWKCLAETYERHLWKKSFFFDNKLVKSTFKKLSANALDPNTLVGFSDEQKKNNKILDLTDDTVLGWVPGKMVNDNSNILVPAQLVSALYASNNAKTPDKIDAAEPLLRWAVTTGLATGQTKDEAIVKGVLEVIERHAFMKTFLNKISPSRVDLDLLAEDDLEISKLIKSFKRYQLQVHAVLLPNEFDIYIPMVVILDETKNGPACAIGAAAGFDLRLAIKSAWAEAMTTRLALKINFPFENIKHPLGHKGRIQYYTDHNNLNKIDFMWKGNVSQIQEVISLYDQQESRELYYTKKKEILVKKLIENKYNAVYVPMDVNESNQIPFSVVFVVIPEAHPLHLDERLPYWGGDIVPTFNREPHPFP